MHGYYEDDTSAAPDPGVRAADADREATAERLRQHHAEGRLDVTEFQDRLDRTYRAQTFGELGQLVSDLPRDPQRGPGLRHRLGPAWMSPWIPVVLVIIAVSALSGHHHGGGPWILIPLFFLARFSFWGRRPWPMRRHR